MFNNVFGTLAVNCFGSNLQHAFVNQLLIPCLKSLADAAFSLASGSENVDPCFPKKPANINSKKRLRLAGQKRYKEIFEGSISYTNRLRKAVGSLGWRH